MKIISLSDGLNSPLFKSPTGLLLVMAIALPIAFSTWSALLNNFVIEVADFDGSDIGWLHTIREIPGFLAVGVLAILMIVREQILALIMLGLLGITTAVTAYFPTWGGIMMITLLSSIGFHYFETANQSLQLQWIKKDKAPQVMGWLIAAGSAATFAVYVIIVLSWKTFGLDFNQVYLASGV